VCPVILFRLEGGTECVSRRAKEMPQRDV